MDGGYNSVTFICSKTDDISLMEATASLGLEDEIGDLWTKTDAYDKDIREMEKTLEEHKDRRNDVCAVMEQAEEDLEVWEKLRDDVQDGKSAYAPKTKSAKRKRNANTSSSRKKSRMDDSDNDFVDDSSDSADDEDDEASESDGHSEDEAQPPLTENEIVAKIVELKAIRKNGRQERAKLGEEIKIIKNQIKAIEEQSNVIAATIAEHCISGRNNYSRDAIRQDFAAGIKEIDQELSEQMDAANFDPEKDARDYDEVAKSLPVYCVSSRGYQKLMGRLKKDADVHGFKDVVETEIPQLQAHCKKLTEAGREGACRRFLNSLSQLLNSLRLWSSSDGVVRMLSEGQLKRESLWLEDRLTKFDKVRKVFFALYWRLTKLTHSSSHLSGRLNTFATNLQKKSRTALSNLLRLQRSQQPPGQFKLCSIGDRRLIARIEQLEGCTGPHTKLSADAMECSGILTSMAS